MSKVPWAPTGTAQNIGPRRIRGALTIGLIVGALGALQSHPRVDQVLVEAGRPVSAFDLSLLFALRGDVAAPQEVVVVAVDEESAHTLGLPPNPRDWPRYWHACLVDRLVEGGVAVITFDLFFDARASPDAPLSPAFLSRSACQRVATALDPRASPSMSHDRVLQDTIRRGTRPDPATRSKVPTILLYENTDLMAMSVDGVEIKTQTRIPPLDALARAATGTAPFVVPTGRVDRFWPVKRIAGRDGPTLPFLAIQAFALHHVDDLLISLRRAGIDELSGLLNTGNAGYELDALMNSLAEMLDSHPDLSPRILKALELARSLESSEVRRWGLDAWRAVVRVSSDSRAHFLSFYGAPGTVTTISYADLLDASRNVDLAGKAVFVGVSDVTKVDSRDTFDTVFSTGQDVQLGGVEIAATAFGNLLHDRTLRRPTASVAAIILLLFGTAAGILAYLVYGWLGIAATTALWCAHMVVAFRFFVADAVWLPVTVPLLQVVFALLMSYAWHYVQRRRQLAFVSAAFGRYVPVGPEATSIARSSFGTVLFSDMKSFTTIGEQISPARLIEFLNEYYAVVAPPLEKHGGVITQIQGDCILAVFNVVNNDPDHATNAVRAALDMHCAIDNATFLDGARVSARIGINSGDMVASTVGSASLSSYTVQGDAVNTAARLEQLNKEYGTRILIGEETVKRLADQSICRKIGEVAIRGKQRHVVVYAVPLDTALG